MAVAIWIMGICFRWAISRAFVRQQQLADQLEHTQRQLAQQALVAERRQIARLMSTTSSATVWPPSCCRPVCSARHGCRTAIRRPPRMRFGRPRKSAVAACRSSVVRCRCFGATTRPAWNNLFLSPPSPRSPRSSIGHARGRSRRRAADARRPVARSPPGVGVAVCRITEEALANAARHAPRARTSLGLRAALTNGRVAIVAQTTVPIVTSSSPSERERPRYCRSACRSGRRRSARRVCRRAHTRRLAGQLPAPGGRRRNRGGGEIRVALVDDQAIVRAGLARILSPPDGFEVVAECADGRQAVEELPALHPDVVLMDIRMPALDGVAATAHLRAMEDPSRRPRAHHLRGGRGAVGGDRGWGRRVRAQGQFGGGPDRCGSGRRRRRSGWFDSGGRALAARTLSAGGGAGGPRLGSARPAHRA